MSAHLHGLFAAIGVSNDFYSNIASVRGGLKFIDLHKILKFLFGLGFRFRYSFICQGTSTRRQRRDLFDLRVKLPPVITSLTSQR